MHQLWACLARLLHVSIRTIVEKWKVNSTRCSSTWRGDSDVRMWPAMGKRRRAEVKMKATFWSDGSGTTDFCANIRRPTRSVAQKRWTGLVADGSREIREWEWVRETDDVWKITGAGRFPPCRSAATQGTEQRTSCDAADKWLLPLSATYRR
jgi:hypothetical protein